MPFKFMFCDFIAASGLVHSLSCC